VLRPRQQAKLARGAKRKYVRPYSKGQKNDFRDAEAIAEAVQRPTMKLTLKELSSPRRLSRSVGVGRPVEVCVMLQ